MTPTRMAVLLVLLAGCATGGAPGLSSLGREVKVTPAQKQTEAQLMMDDVACDAWTRANTGKGAPFPDKGLRYAACAVSRGYQAELFYVPLSDPTGRSLDAVVSGPPQLRP